MSCDDPWTPLASGAVNEKVISELGRGVVGRRLSPTGCFELPQAPSVIETTRTDASDRAAERTPRRLIGWRTRAGPLVRR